ncbi:MAG: peroxidase family protein, partial [Bacteroidota bacterium]
ISTDPEVFAKLQDLYDNVNNIDAWVGMLVETPMSDALFGETIMEIMIRQFGALRDGDRFYFENDPVFTAVEVEAIKRTTFRDIIMRNTNITLMQGNVFAAMPHDSICPTAVSWVDLTGNIKTENGLNVEEVTVRLSDATESALATSTSNDSGNFSFESLTTCEHYRVRPSYNEDIRNGVNTNDMVKMAKHILNTELLDSPYKIIAGDIDNNGSVNVADLIHLHRVILFIDSSFVNTPPWRFVDANYVFQNPTQPLAESFAEEADIIYLSEQTAQNNFVAIKTGDLNLDVTPNNLQSGDTRNEPQMTFYTQDQRLEIGKEYTLEFNTSQLQEVNAYQYTLDFDTDALDFVQLLPGAIDNMSERNFGLLLDQGAITTSWFGEATNENSEVFRLTFRAKQEGQLSDYLQLNS